MQQERNDRFVKLEAHERTLRDIEQSMKDTIEQIHQKSVELGTDDSVSRAVKTGIDDR